MTAIETDRDCFTRFVEEVGPRLTQALIARFGGELGREMTAEALAYGWEHWDRVGGLDNPAGYLYRVGQNRGRRTRRPYLLPDPPLHKSEPVVEPGLPSALGPGSSSLRSDGLRGSSVDRDRLGNTRSVGDRRSYRADIRRNCRGRFFLLESRELRSATRGHSR